MRLVGGTSEAIDNYAVPQCQALCRAEFVWAGQHQCPWRGRYSRQRIPLCGHHVQMETVELVDQVVTPLRSRKRA